MKANLISEESLKEIMSDEKLTKAEKGYKSLLLVYEQTKLKMPKYLANANGKSPSRTIGVERTIEVGDTFTVTGGVFFCPIYDNENKLTSLYPAIPVVRDRDAQEFNLSFQQVMNIANDKGFEYTGAFDHETYAISEDDKKVKLVQTVEADFISGYSFSQVWQPITREFYALWSIFLDLEDKIKGSKLTFAALVCKPRKARKDSPEGNFESYLAGYKRVESHKLYYAEWAEGVTGVSK